MTENIICAFIAAGASIVCSIITLIGVILGLSKAENTLIKTFSDNYDVIRDDFNHNYNNYFKYDIDQIFNDDYKRKEEFLWMLLDAGFMETLEDIVSREYKIVILKYLSKDKYKKLRGRVNLIVAGVKEINNLDITEDCYESRYLHYQQVYTALGNTSKMDPNNIDLKNALSLIGDYLSDIHQILNSKK